MTSRVVSLVGVCASGFMCGRSQRVLCVRPARSLKAAPSAQIKTAKPRRVWSDIFVLAYLMCLYMLCRGPSDPIRATGWASPIDRNTIKSHNLFHFALTLQRPRQTQQRRCRRRRKQMCSDSVEHRRRSQCAIYARNCENCRQQLAIIESLFTTRRAACSNAHS